MRHVGYCVKCDSKKEIKEGIEVTMNNGRGAIKGLCLDCKSPLFKFTGGIGFTDPDELETQQVNHPQYYGGEDNPYEAIKVIEAWDLNFSLGNVVKYISRAGKKDSTKFVEDLEKAKQYIEFELKRLKNES